jgi:hypothetical protein
MLRMSLRGLVCCAQFPGLDLVFKVGGIGQLFGWF